VYSRTRYIPGDIPVVLISIGIMQFPGLNQLMIHRPFRVKISRRELPPEFSSVVNNGMMRNRPRDACIRIMLVWTRAAADDCAVVVMTLGSLNLYSISVVGAGTGVRGWSLFAGMVSQRRAYTVEGSGSGEEVELKKVPAHEMGP
jgi:hypothetical protein